MVYNDLDILLEALKMLGLDRFIVIVRFIVTVKEVLRTLWKNRLVIQSNKMLS